MKTQNQEKATGAISEMIERATIWKKFGIQAGKIGRDNDFEALLKSAATEHAALLAVADLTIKMQSHFTSGGTRSEYIALDHELNQSLANLAAVQNK